MLAAPGEHGHAWPALLAQTQANREVALAIPELAQTQANRDLALAICEQAQANRAAAAALLHAMHTHGDPCGHAMQADELHCWHIDAQVAVVVASQTAARGVTQHHDSSRRLGMPMAPYVMTPPSSAYPPSAPSTSEPPMWPLKLLTASKKTGAPSHRGPDTTPVLTGT